MMKTKEQIIKEFNESLEYSPSTTDLTYKRLILELFTDLRDAISKTKET